MFSLCLLPRNMLHHRLVANNLREKRMDFGSEQDSAKGLHRTNTASLGQEADFCHHKRFHTKESHNEDLRSSTSLLGFGGIVWLRTPSHKWK